MHQGGHAGEQWLPLRSVTLELESHPQETTENSVDQGLLIVVHGYEAVSVLEPLKVDGPYLTAKYTMTRVNPWLSVFPAIVNAFRVHVWGLGYSMVEIHTETFDFHFRLFILPMPLDGDRIQLRIALTVRRDCTAASVSPVLGVLPGRCPSRSFSERPFKASSATSARTSISGSTRSTCSRRSWPAGMVRPVRTGATAVSTIRSFASGRNKQRNSAETLNNSGFL